ncbi:MAG: hypothetical protein PHP20_03900 [Firmicutes bacterium]|nr:hypothetical protein [Bacillota bacterium]MDD4337058.1 hypothetical protein [Bacillota bacterium]MDD4792186.1 hypothetical protein [Bacillota bacterium]
MLYILMGQSCTGKSTAARSLQKLTGAEVFTGRDYLRMGSNENAAWQNFIDRLASAAGSEDASTSIIYVLTERDDLSGLSMLDDAIRVKFTASIDTIRSRFAQRMNGHLPTPVEKMLDRQFEAWKDVEADLYVDTTEERSSDEIARTILDFASRASK